MKFIRNITLFGVIVFLSSCAVSGPQTVPAALVTKNDVGTKEGVAERTIWLGIWIGNTDLSITKAAKNGKITKIATVDSEIESGFLKTTYRTIVTGE
ncbi:MAG: hypothetical protein CMC96_11855 [Flavobacteriales bacterium]|nr:hypothetical protein [Flavobacteriales bacterium]|tara:strand:- start:8118 stop:8408 length:291 start_codon:yes stop_codon:yes gene_type:complete